MSLAATLDARQTPNTGKNPIRVYCVSLGWGIKLGLAVDQAGVRLGRVRSDEVESWGLNRVESFFVGWNLADWQRIIKPLICVWFTLAWTWNGHVGCDKINQSFSPFLSSWAKWPEPSTPFFFVFSCLYYTKAGPGRLKENIKEKERKLKKGNKNGNKLVGQGRWNTRKKIKKRKDRKERGKLGQTLGRLKF